MKNIFSLAILLCACTAAAQTAPQPPAGQTGRSVEGTVADAQGLPIVGAQVTLIQPQNHTSRTVTTSAAKFRFDNLAPGAYVLRVNATGFQQQQMPVDLTADMTKSVDVKLAPAGITEETIVTATRSEQRVADVPASVNIVGSEQIERSPAVVADDVLRQVPTFSLFRRTSSLAANPTAQGVSLRGIGPSGVSRTLVLLDDVPFNDPFGGWVYWTRIPLMNTDRIEMVDGASSSLYGNYAMGGVINIVTNPPQPRTLVFKPQYGNRGTPKMDLFASDVWNKVGVTVDASTLRTDGYKIVAPQEAGPIDNEANVRYQNGSGKLDFAASDRVNLFVRGGVFDEHRNNGKIGELNDTNWRYGNVGGRASLADGSAIEGRLFFDHEHFHQNTFAVPAATPPRSQSNLTLDKNVPTQAMGAMAQWTRGFQLGSRAHAVSAGFDFRHIKGDSDENTYALATGLTPIVHRVAGGTQQASGFFVQDMFEAAPKLQITLSARGDRWRNYAAHDHETTLATGAPVTLNCSATTGVCTGNRDTLPDKSDNAFSPRAAALYRASDKVGVWGSVSRGFRAPTLKELYSPFRVGAVLTQSNETLGPERLTGEEAGVSVMPTSALTIRGTWFNNRVNNPVANITVATNVRLLQNLGSTNIDGFQTDAAYRVNPCLTLSAAYLFENAKVHESKADSAGVDLTGKFLAEVPKNRGSFQINFTDPKLVNVTWDTEIVGMQFDDDQNVAKILPGLAGEKVGLPAYSVSNLTVTRRLNKQADVFFGAQNLFGTLYYVGTNPTTIGTPRLVNGGVRLRVGR